MTLDMTASPRYYSKEQGTRDENNNTDKLEFTEVKNVCASKDTIEGVQILPTERGVTERHI